MRDTAPRGSRSWSMRPPTIATAPRANSASCLPSTAVNSARRVSVAWMFDAVGVIEVDPQGASEDALTESSLVDGVIDVDYTPARAYIYTVPAQLATARDALRGELKVADVYLGVRAKQTVAPEGGELAAALAFLEVLENHEDIQHVFSNLDVSEAALEALT